MAVSRCITHSVDYGVQLDPIADCKKQYLFLECQVTYETYMAISFLSEEYDNNNMEREQLTAL